jgi:hypothetical protein
LLALPLRIPFAPLFFLAAQILSIFEKRKAYNADGIALVAKLITDEEPVNLALLLLLLFSSPMPTMLIYSCLFVWAFIMWSEWGYEMLEESATTGKQIYGLPAMQPVIDFGMVYRVELALFKSHLEIVLAFVSVCLILTGRLAPIFPIFYWQYLRIRYLVSNYTKHSFSQLDSFFKKLLPNII